MRRMQCDALHIRNIFAYAPNCRVMLVSLMPARQVITGGLLELPDYSVVD